jgi:hypothetical protein
MKEGISIVMTYFNRKVQLYRTLTSIRKTSYDKSKMEIIIINDNGDYITDLLNAFSDLNIILCTIKKDEKIWKNPCIPYNIGFKLIHYDKVIIQNPETYHKGDILEYVNKNLTNDNYITFGCYSVPFQDFIKSDYDNIQYVDKIFTSACSPGWYNHQIYNPSYLHFCSAISYDNLCKLNGFDEKYKDGIGYDDNEFLYRVKLLGLKLEIISDPIVLHQWHSSPIRWNTTDTEKSINEKRKLFKVNSHIYNNYTLKKDTYLINENKYFNNNTKIIKKDGISIVMSYFDRRDLIIKTLQSIHNSSFDKNKLQIIIVNDCSSSEHSIDDLNDIFKDLNILVININEKTWFNCCIPFNIGFNFIIYDKIIIQNPECYHKGDILDYTYKNLNDNVYLSYASYSLSWDDNTKNYNEITILNEKYTVACAPGWFNHSIYHPMYYHYCSSITFNNLSKLNGFDERYKDGIAWDDDEFVTRIKNMKLDMKIIDEPFVLHQAHSTHYRINSNTSEDVIKYRNCLFVKNKELFQNATKVENKYKAEHNIYFNNK